MGFATLIFFLYIILVLVGLVFLGLWLMRYLSRLPYTPEKRMLFTATAIACLTIIAFSIGAKINAWRTADNSTQTATQGALLPQNTNNTPSTNNTNINATTQPQESRVPDELADNNSTIVIGSGNNNRTSTALNYEELLELFERDNYPELYQQRMGLLQEINAQRAFLEHLPKLAQLAPKQRPLLAEIYRIRKAAYDRLQQRNVTVSQELRDFWVHYNTGNSDDATKKFNRVAPRLTKNIKETLGQMLDSSRREEQAINRHLRQAGQALKSNKIPARLAGKITSYSSQNRATIIDWLSRQDGQGDARVLEILERLFQERSIMRDRYKQVVAFQKRYPDLKNRLERTLQLWAKAQESNYYAEYRLLYAAEARFIIDDMGLALSSGQTADKRLAKDINAYTEFVAGHAEDAFKKAEEAYKPTRVR